MKKNLINDIFGCSEDEFTKVMNGWAKVYEDIFGDKSDDEKDEDDKSYLRVKGYRYDNGKLVKKYDKEFVDGECTKNDEFNAEKAVEDKANDGKHNDRPSNGCCKCSNEEKEPCQLSKSVLMQRENEDLKSQIDEMRHYIDGLNDKIKTLQIENDGLRNVVDNIKKCF